MTQLLAGDLAIVGYDSNDPDDFTFVLLRDIDAGTVISFTDNGWLASGGFRSGEGTVTYTAATAVAAGTAITLTGLDLDSAGDQIIAYQGSPAAPTLLYAIDFADGDNAFAGDATSANTSALPSGLILGSTAVAIAFDNAAYTGPIPPTQAALLAAIGDPTNWSGSDLLRGLPGSIFGAGKPDLDLDFNNSTHGGRDYATDYAQGGVPVRISDTDIRIADSTSATLESATIEIKKVQPDDLLLVSGALPAGITASPYNPVTGVLMLSGTASLADYEIAIGQIRFSSTGESIGTNKQVLVSVFDGETASSEAKAHINIVAATAPPTLDLDANNSNGGGADYTATFQEGGPAIRIADVDVTITDPDSTAIASATVTIGVNRQADDLLSINGALPAGIVASAYNSSTGVLTLTGAASLAAYQTALHQVVYSNSSSTPFTGDRVIEVTVNDGTVDSNIARTFMQVVDVANSPPILNLDANSSTTGGVDYLTAFTDGGAPVAIVDTDVLILDSDSATLASATITLTNPHTDDILVFNGVPPRGITASSYDPVSGVLTLTGVASLASYQAALQQITFSASLNPDTDSRIIEVVVNDGIAASNTANAIVNVLEVNNSAPDLSLDPDDSTAPGSSYRNTFTENGAPVPIADVDTTITDPDSTTMASARITLTDPQTGDLLTISGAPPAGIVASIYNPVTGILTLTGTASLIAYQTALTQIGFSTAGDDPVAGQRILEIVVNDGVNDSNAATALITVAAVNDAPVITVDTSATYVESTASIVLSPLATLFDVDNSEFIFAEVEIADGSFAGAGDVLTVNGATSGTLGGVNFLWDPALATLVFNGAAPVATYQALLQQVEFASTGDNPTDFNASPSRTLLWTVTGGDTSATVTSTVEILALNDPPSLTVAATASYTENDAPVTISPAATVTDADNLNLVGGQVRITSGAQPGDILTVNGLQSGSFAGIDFAYDFTSNRLLFDLSAAVADYQTFLQAVQFQSTSDDPTNGGADPTRTLSWVVSGGLSFSTVETTTLTITAVDDAPVNTVPGPQSVAEDTAFPIVGVSVADVDSTALTTTLTVASGTLNVTPGAGVSGNGTGTVIIAGTAAEINAVLAGLTYQGNLNFNGPDTLTVATSDGTTTDTDAVAITVNAVNDAPVNTVPAAQSVNEDTALPIVGVSVADVDSTALTTTLTVASGTLNVTPGAGVSGNGTGTVIIAGTAAEINAVLAGLTYQGNLNFNGPDTLTVATSDGTTTDTDAVAITVNAVNDAPVNTVPGAQSVNEDTAFPIVGVSVADVDSTALTTTLTVASGTLNVTPGAGVSGNGTGTVIIAGTAAEINAALAGLTYQGNLNFNGPNTLTVATSDGTTTDTDAVAITVNAVNDAPVNTVPGAQSVNEDTAFPIVGVSVADVDSTALTTTLTVASGTLNVTPGAGVSGNGTGTVIIAGTAAEINAVLAGLTYQGNLNFNGPDTLTVATSDGTTTDTDAVAITVNAVNDAPVNTVPAAQSVNEDTALPIVGVSVADVDSTALTTTLTVASGTLNVTPGAGVSGNGTGTVIIAGTAAEINAALAGLTYQGNLNFNGSDALTVVTSDTSLTDTDTVVITVIPVNDPPALDLDANNSSGAGGVNYTATFTEGGPPVAIADADTLVTEVDSTFLLSATIRLLNHQTDDLLSVTGTLPAGITASAYDPATGVITLTSVPGTSLADFQTALHAIAFSSSSTNPDPTDRIVNVVVSDGLVNSNPADGFIHVVPLNNSPTLDLDANGSSGALTATGYTATFTQGGAAVAIADVDTVISDADNTTLESATITIINGEATDLLSVNGALPSVITASGYDPVTGILTLTGTATLADYQTALHQIEYSSSSASPDTATRIIKVVVNDGANDSAAAFSFMHVIDEAATLDLDADDSTAGGTDFAATYTEGGTPAPIADTDVAIAGSANIVSATITLTNRFADDTLSASGTPPGGITASGYDPVTGMLTLTGTASLADYQTALQQIGFSNSSDDPATDDRIIEVVVNDGIGDSNAATAIIHVNAVNDPPTLAVAGAASYVENTPPVTLSPAVAVGDPDNTILTAAAVAITAGALAGDVLTLGGSLTGRSGAIQFDWLPDVQHLILIGPGSPAEYEALLQSVQFHSTSDDPTGLGSDPTRTISWTVFDGAIPVTETTTLNVTAVNDAPILGNVAASATFAAHASPVTLSPGIDVADVDSPNLIGAVVKITDGSFAGDGDLLTANTAGTAISGVYDAVTETLTLSGADTLAHYQQALATVTFQSTSANPTNSELNPTRTISWQLDDGGGVNNLSTIAVTNLDIIPPNGTIDLNGDSKGDILWQHEDSTPGAWLVDALTVLSTPILGLPEVGAADWLEIGSGDFNGDGKSDILWQHSPISTATGPASAPGIWLMDGTAVQAHDWVGTPDLWSADWTVIGSGDFNGDGKSDILWQHSPVSTATGPASAPGIWLMDGTAVQAHDLVGTPDLWSVNWTVIGSGDFNGDGKADILWQNSNGEAGIWLMDGLTVVAHDVVGANPGPSAHAIGTGDFNGDGKADILWQNDNGQASIWLMDGLSVLSARNVGDNPGTSWKVIGANDLNADGKADILWQHDDGTAGGWLMDGTTVLSTGVIGENPGPQWDMIPRHDLAI